ncbi:MAG: DUF2079 domain-containing protein [Brachybacterium sp.]|nr:DUF2079 domain-containing protein [Brachybacterium sp.]
MRTASTSGSRALPSPAPTHRRSGARARIVVPAVLALVAAVVYGTLGQLQWRDLVAPSWDLGIFTQLARAYGELRSPLIPIKGDGLDGAGMHLLGDHFHPILVLLAPVWWIWPSGAALLWTQAILFALSAVPLTRLAMERLGNGVGGVAGAAYVFSFGLQSAQAVQFHEIAFGVPLLAFALVALLRGRVMAACVWASVLVFVKEDLGLTVALLGLLIAWRHRAFVREGLSLAAWGGAWFLVSTFVILPWLNPAGQYDYTDNLGSLLDIVVPLDKWVTVGMLLLAAGLIGVRSPLILLMLPTLAWRFTGTVDFYWSWYWHYNAILMPIAVAALIDACQGPGRWSRDAPEIATQAVRSLRTRWVAVGASAAVTLALTTSMPLWQLTQPSSWEQTWRAEPAAQAMAVVPEGAVVAADIPLLAPLVPEHDVQWLHGPNVRVPQCVVLDDYAFSWRDRPPVEAAAWADEHYAQDPGAFTGLYDQGGYQVACRLL